MTSPTDEISAIVLAGGRSSRFGRDKLAEPVGGTPLLRRAIAAVRPLVSEVLVVTAPGGDPDLPDDVRLVHDPVAFEGPLSGLVTGLDGARGPVAIVVGGDSPSLVGAVLASMLDRLSEPAIQAVVLEHEGRPRPLPIVLRREPALLHARELFESGERRLRAILDRLEVEVVPELVWRELDPDGATVRDIDTPEDADLPSARYIL
jgi:molybdopterin-guanine dinucleotide biosynthesis protein A